MANKKISELESRASLSLSDLMAVGDPSTGYLYKTTISDLKTLTGAGVVSFNGRFGTVNPAEGDYTLTQLGDVIITSASNGQLLQYNGSNWVNWTPNYLAGNQAITLSGDATGSGTTSIAVTLANSGVTAGSYGSSTSIPVITVDAKGRVTLVSTATVTTTLAALTDVSISSIANNQLLRYNSATSKWENWTPNYLTSYTETDTLNSVTGRGNTTANDITVGSVTAAGLSNLLGQIKTFASTGNTYIGASPASATDAGYKLDVNGTVRISNDLTMWDDGANNGNSRALILRALGSTGNVQTGQIILDGFGAAGQDQLQLSASNIRLSPTTGSVTITGTTPNISTVAASGFRLNANSTTNGFTFTQSYNQTSGDLLAIFTNSNQKKFSVSHAGIVTVADLSGTGSRMVVADANGVMSTQAIPTGSVTSVFGRTGAVVAANGDYTTSQVTEGSNLYYTDARARAAITLTTTGSSGAATYSGGTLNIPTYTLAGLGGQPALSGTGFVKISGTTISYDNSTYLTTSSAASTYLPLAGGTLTGALNGTSATFSGNVQFGTESILNGNNWYLLSGAANNELAINFSGKSGAALKFYSAQTPVFSVTSAGAGSFGASVTAGGDVYIPNGNYYYAKRSTGGANINVLGFASGSDTLTLKGGTSGATNSINFEDTGGVIASFYNGRFGIGNTNPVGKLHIAAPTAVTTPGSIALAIRDSGNSGYGFDFNLEGVATGDLSLMRTEAGSQAQVMTFKRSNGNVSIGSISATAKLTVSGSQVETHINNGDTNTLTLGGFSSGRHFIKSINLGVALTPLTLQASSFNFDSGNVGINTTNPTTLLNIEKNIAGTGLGDGMIFKLKNTSTTTNTRSGIVFGNIDGIGGALAMQAAILKNAATGEYDMTWDFYGGAAGWKEGLLYLDSNPGNVGINTVSPSATLHVNGTLKTGNPGLGSAGAIKIGQVWSGTAITGGNYLPIDIDGTTYYINLFSQTP
jgi:hypothetical protein